MKSRHFLSLTLALSLLTTGCMRTNILEQTGLIVMVGYDEAGDGKIRGTSLLYQVDPHAKEKTQVIASVASSSKGSRDVNNLGMAKKMVSGQLRVALYSDELARKSGMLELADTLSRDANVGRMLYVAVCKGKAMDLMSFRYPETANLGTFLYQDIKQNTHEGIIPSSTLHEFIRDSYEHGRDPVVPIIEKQEKKITISGIALFQDDRMVGETPAHNGFYIKAFRDSSRPSYLEVKMKNAPLRPLFRTTPKKEETTVVFATLNQKGEIKLTDPANLKFQISLHVRAEMLEISEQVDLSKPDTEAKIADALSQQMTQELQQLLTHLQTLKSDPIGLGEIYRSTVRHSNLNRDKWHTMLAKAHLTPKVDVTLVRSGVVE
ncbi:Ger(x)C family spore germination protein [Tumebacillus sp. ITR2]|uniref:Ger(X)C family spore germination protein n=1 Tax=Tumebacillus amylolyticus TaxID=2801339 RepID=A0ABS1JFR1_9BACL|nr:Ger(x)C family spore germination protein [Tumebacillus amylolyticus]MBL0389123.1 Ger(x)C family spore germination protein [Tumebacillus amylolyticus]